MSRFFRHKLCNNGWEEREESFPYMNWHLKFIESLWHVLEKTLQRAGLHYQIKDLGQKYMHLLVEINVVMSSVIYNKLET